MSDGAKLSHPPGLLALSAAFALAFASLACGSDRPRPTPCYDATTRKLVRLDLDADGDGYVEQRTYLNGNLPFRTETDSDQDGRIDHWEYVDAHAQVIKVGSSSRNDGIEDEWIYPTDAAGQRRVERSSERTARADRREIFEGETLVRTEEDTNQDGLPDKWEFFERGVLQQLAYDTTHAHGKPDRRLSYDAQGHFVRLEVDDDGDGTFDPVTNGR